MVKLKKGVFYTISGFFLVSLVLILSILVTTAIQQSNQRLTEAGGFERIISLDESLVKTINNLDNGLTITLEEQEINSEYVTLLQITEQPNQDFSDYTSNFQTNLQNLESYVESDQPEIQFDLTKLYNSTNRLSIFVKPHSLVYTHVKDSSSNRTLIKIEPPETLTDTEITIDLGNYQVNGTNILNWASTQYPGSFNFTVTVVDDFGYSESEIANIDLSRNNTFTISYTGRQAQVQIGQLCYQCIKIDHGGFNITSTFSTNLEDLGESVTVNYPTGLYTINFSNLGIYVNKTPSLL